MCGVDVVVFPSLWECYCSVNECLFLVGWLIFVFKWEISSVSVAFYDRKGTSCELLLCAEGLLGQWPGLHMGIAQEKREPQDWALRCNQQKGAVHGSQAIPDTCYGIKRCRELGLSAPEFWQCCGDTAFTHSSPPVPGEVFVKLLKISLVLKFLQYSRKISPGLQMNQGIFLCALMCSVPLICCFGWSHLPWDVARAHSERKFSLIRCGIKTLVSKLLQQEKIKSTEEVTVRTHEAQDSGFSEAYLRINLLKNKVLLKNCCLDPR